MPAHDLNHTHPRPWRWEFDAYGGYDHMSAAYHIYAANDRLVCDVDVKEYWPRYAERLSEADWDYEMAPNVTAQAVASLIVKAANAAKGV